MVSMQVDPAMVKGIVLKEIQAAVVAQLNQAPMMIENVVKLALSVKTNSSGDVSSSSYENRYDLIEALAAKAIRECAQKAVQDWVGTNREKVLAAIKREMEKRKSAIIQQFVDAASNAINPGFHVSCSIQPRESR